MVERKVLYDGEFASRLVSDDFQRPWSTYEDIKMGPFDVVTGRDHLVSQSGSVTILCESLKMFSRNGRRTRIFVCLLVCICLLTILP